VHSTQAADCTPVHSTQAADCTPVHSTAAFSDFKLLFFEFPFKFHRDLHKFAFKFHSPVGRETLGARKQLLIICHRGKGGWHSRGNKGAGTGVAYGRHSATPQLHRELIHITHLKDTTASAICHSFAGTVPSTAHFHHNYLHIIYIDRPCDLVANFQGYRSGGSGFDSYPCQTFLGGSGFATGFIQHCEDN
jgi:hypothetical protein